MKIDKKHCLIFLTIFLLLAGAVWLAIPKTNVYGQIDNSSINRNPSLGNLYIRVEDEDEEFLDGVTINIAAKRYNKDSSIPDIDDGSSVVAVTNPRVRVGNTALDELANHVSADEYSSNTIYKTAFSYTNENKAILTLTENTIPNGYADLSKPIVIEYSYVNSEDGGDPTWPSSNSNRYILKVEVTGGAAGEYKLDEELVFSTPSYTDYTLVITKKKATAQTYTEKYSYSDADTLPDAVKSTIPTRKGTYNVGDTVTPADPSSKEVYVASEKKTYKFNGWTPASVTITDKDAEFVGSWTAVSDPDETTGGNDDPTTPPSDDSTDGGQTDTSTDKSGSAKTGDSNNVIPYVALLLICALSAPAVVHIYKRRRNN